ncbi:MAG: DUF58 domain-containing protein, partial [Lentisphaerae bacterium]|nr:DUF58 domain-containing protein [Lentisphaerota bacterium]
ADPRELCLPDAGLLEVLNPETGELLLVDTRCRRLLAQFQRQAAAEQQALAKQFLRFKMDCLTLTTDRPFVDDVHRLFYLRRRRLRRG